uniref:DUF1640 domain-containing protein n=1 Tax=Candidatus Kentrum sp. MB TaxID=2138164 RepID=A0A450XTM8_9GAMM|nr:MAG: hypothetical protein BECKMB1821G_GA0114241_1001119 [Candidatus Kentron sp. MB]VFK32661.1 MAG: hypothetical protein BECKMB1821I_GA0114274_103539 [Candidatus Kentron sp. MB]VFK76019.1 MAG: hypothetical protein BECKMB1821H_GA0114242_103838 [Candidatus Kentron sp. MB]
MFDNDIFEKWLGAKSQEIVEKMGRGEPLLTEEMMVLVLKAQSNHFYHLDKDLRNEMKMLREDMGKRFESVDKRFENVDKRFESVDKRFESMDKRFEQVIRRIDRFMFWSLGITIASAAFVVTYLK